MNFDSHAGAVVQIAVELVNVATPGYGRGREYVPPTGSALADALQSAVASTSRGQHGRLRGARLTALADLGADIRPVFERVQDGDLDAASRAVNRLLAIYRPTPYLDHHDGEPWHLHYHGSAESDRSGWGGGVAVALAGVLGSEYADRLGVCEASACDRVFVDVSRNGTRRYCSTACQNRVKAAAHRARQR
jgi:hypothetical protein